MLQFKPYIHHAKELEEAILGACLIDKLAFGRVYGALRAEIFYYPAHSQVFGALVQMYENSAPIDLLTLSHWLIDKMGVNDFGGENVLYFLSRLTNSVVSSANLEYHSFLIREMYERREILKIKFSDPGDETDPRRMSNSIQEQIRKVLGNEAKKDWYSMDEIIYQLMVHQADMHSGKKSFVKTGFKKIDRLNGGFGNGQLIVIGARPSVGKSAFMGQIALNVAHSGKKVGIVSMEMNNVEIAARLSSLETDIDFGTIYRDIMRDEALHARFYESISKKTVHLPIFLSDKTKVNVNEIKAKAIKLKASSGCDLVIVDYLQLIDSTTDNRNYNREQEVAKMSRGLKLMAMELDIPVIVLAQLNRQSTARTYDKRFPQLSDLRESGAIEQDADVVMFIHRDWMSGWQVDGTGASTENQADLICPKWRSGQTFHLPIGFDGSRMKFYELQETTWAPVTVNNDESEDEPF